MLSRSLFEMVKGRWREFKREPSAMFFVIFMPILWMVVLGVAFSDSKAKHYKLSLIEAVDPASQELQGTIANILAQNSQLTVVPSTRDMAELALKRGDTVLSVELLTEGGYNSAQKLVYSFDPTNPEAGMARLLSDQVIESGLGRKDLMASEERLVTRTGSRYIDFLIPGLLALSLFTSSFFGTGMTIVAHRRENLLKRYCATPMNPYEYILSHIVGRYMIMAVELVCIVAAGWALFNFQVEGSWLNYVLVCVLGTSSFTALAIFLGARLSNTATYNGLNNLLMLPSMVMAGVWFSRSNFPNWLNAIAGYLPLTACVDAMRKIALEGASLSQVRLELCILLAYGAIATVAARKMFKWY